MSFALVWSTKSDIIMMFVVFELTLAPTPEVGKALMLGLLLVDWQKSAAAPGQKPAGMPPPTSDPEAHHQF